MDEKGFLTYNQQMRKLRDDKGLLCKGSLDKKILVQNGYFNLINGYKTPFISGTDKEGVHQYIPETSIKQLNSLKRFDDDLRIELLSVITRVEEELRALTAYKFDSVNDNGNIPWYSIDAYSPKCTLKNKMDTISKAYSELSRSHLDYVKYYMENHKQIPTWIMLKAVNFSTFIDILDYSKRSVPHSICLLFDLIDEDGHPDVKLLIGSVHWMRKIRNACAHNERIYTISDSGRLSNRYFELLGKGYTRVNEKRVFDLLIYLKYYLSQKDFKKIVGKIKAMLLELENWLNPNSFDYVRAQLGIKRIEDLEHLACIPKDDADYCKFDKIANNEF